MPKYICLPVRHLLHASTCMFAPVLSRKRFKILLLLLVFWFFVFRFMHELQNALKCSEKQLKPNQFSSDGHQRQEMPCSRTHTHTLAYIHTCWGVHFKYLMPLSYQHPSGNHKCGRHRKRRRGRRNRRMGGRRGQATTTKSSHV